MLEAKEMANKLFSWSAGQLVSTVRIRNVYCVRVAFQCCMPPCHNQLKAKNKLVECGQRRVFGGGVKGVVE